MFELHPGQSVTFLRDVICTYQYQQHATKYPLIYFKITKSIYALEDWTLLMSAAGEI